MSDNSVENNNCDDDDDDVTIATNSSISTYYHHSPQKQLILVLPYSSKTRSVAQYDIRSALLVDGLESRACLSTILSYLCSYEGAQCLVIRLCRKGADFLNHDKVGYLKQLCVPEEKIKGKSDGKQKTNTQQKVVRQAISA